MPRTELRAVAALYAGGACAVHHAFQRDVLGACNGAGQGQDDKPRHGFGDMRLHGFGLGKPLSHHRTAVEYDKFVRFCAAGTGQTICYRRADWGTDDSGTAHRTGDGQIFVCERPVLHRIIDTQRGGGVADYAADQTGQTAGRNHPSGDLENQRLLIPGGEKAVKQMQMDVGVCLSNGLLQCINLCSIMML